MENRIHRSRQEISIRPPHYDYHGLQIRGYRRLQPSLMSGASPISANSDAVGALRLKSRLQAVLRETIPPEGGTPNLPRASFGDAPFDVSDLWNRSHF